MSAQDILAKHADRINTRQSQMIQRLQAFFLRNTLAKAWADDLKVVFGPQVRVKRFKDNHDDSKQEQNV